MPERIFITYTNATAIPYQGTTLGHHAVLNYIDSSGNRYTLEGVPERRFDRNIEKLSASVREELLSDGGKNADSPFRRLQVRSGIDPNSAFNGPRTMIAEGSDLNAAWAQMVRFGDEVNSTGYEYRPYSQNSNSFAAAALRRAGFFGPGTPFPEFFDRQLAVDAVGGEMRPFFVPGFDQRLTNPLNKPATMRTHVNGSETPLVPTNGTSEHGRQNSFNGRFGNWFGLPIGSPNQPAQSLETDEPIFAGDKPVRYLSRRIAGKPAASVFQTGALGVPFVPTNDFLSPDTAASFGYRFGDPASSSIDDSPGKRASDAFSPDTQGGLAGRIAALAGIGSANPDPRVLTHENEPYNDGLPQPWLLHALTGRHR
jgi:hypothetical protein